MFYIVTHYIIALIWVIDGDILIGFHILLFYSTYNFFLLNIILQIDLTKNIHIEWPSTYFFFLEQSFRNTTTASSSTTIAKATVTHIQIKRFCL